MLKYNYAVFDHLQTEAHIRWKILVTKLTQRFLYSLHDKNHGSGQFLQFEVTLANILWPVLNHCQVL